MQYTATKIILFREEARKRCPEGVIPACHNAVDSVTVSGDAEKVEGFVEELKKEDIFSKLIDSSGIPFHSPAMLKVFSLLEC